MAGSENTTPLPGGMPETSTVYELGKWLGAISAADRHAEAEREGIALEPEGVQARTLADAAVHAAPVPQRLFDEELILMMSLAGMLTGFWQHRPIRADVVVGSRPWVHRGLPWLKALSLFHLFSRRVAVVNLVNAASGGISIDLARTQTHHAPIGRVTPSVMQERFQPKVNIVSGL